MYSAFETVVFGSNIYIFACDKCAIEKSQGHTPFPQIKTASQCGEEKDSIQGLPGTIGEWGVFISSL